jgi:hypothetical protein
MAITLLGQPDEFAPAYNPMYFYASSTNYTEPNFRYLVDLYLYDPIAGTYTTLANLKIKPRFGDGYLEVNVNKILQSRLVNSLDYIIGNPNNNGAFYNMSGYIYYICVGETYLGQWDFYYITNVPTGNLILVSTDPQPYTAGDIIVTSGIANVNSYSGITDNGGYTQINLITPHDFTTGDLITVAQNSPFEYPQYNGEYAITDATDPNYLVIDLLFQGASTLPQNGTTTRNGFMDATAVVLSAATVGSLYIVETNIPVNVNFPDATTGFTNFVDGTLSVYQSPASGSTVEGTIREELRVYEGVIGHDAFIDYDGDIYSPTYTGATGQAFLTTVPNPWTVTMNSPMILNIWSEWGSGFSRYLEVNTYDCDGGLVRSEQIPNLINSYDSTMINSVVASPILINLAFGNNVISDGAFNDAGDWVITDYDNSNTFISGGALNYEDAIEFGGAGYSYTVQDNVLVSGETYTVTIYVQNNANCSVSVGDSTLYPIVSNGSTGAYTLTFLAVDTDFYVQIIGTSEFTNALTITAVIVSATDAVPLINCDDVCSYTIQVIGSGETGNQLSEIRTFNLDCSCEGRFTTYELGFIDRLNSLIPFTFSLNNKQKVDVKREKFNKQIGGLNSFQGKYKYSSLETSNPNYSIELNEQWELNTNWLTEVESVYFEELMTSPRVVLVDPNYGYIAVNVVSSTYERVRKNNKKMIMHTITIERANNNGIQTG